MPLKIRYVSKFTPASHGSPCDSTPFLLNLSAIDGELKMSINFVKTAKIRQLIRNISAHSRRRIGLSAVRIAHTLQCSHYIISLYLFTSYMDLTVSTFDIS